MRETISLSLPRNVDAGPCVVIEKPNDTAAAVESEACIMPGALITKEAPATIGDHSDESVRSYGPVQA